MRENDFTETPAELAEQGPDTTVDETAQDAPQTDGGNDDE